MELAPVLALLDDARPRGDDAWPPVHEGVLEGRPVLLAETGIGVAAAAAAVGLLAERHRPTACIGFGIAGTYAGAFVPVGAAVCASDDRFLDLGVVTRTGVAGLDTIPLPLVPGDPPSYGTVPTDPAWTDALSAACGTEPVPFATSDGISGDLDVARERAERSGAAVESMEGAATGLACLRTGLPFAALRGVSNVAGQRDAQSWETSRALAAATRALRIAVRNGPA